MNPWFTKFAFLITLLSPYNSTAAVMVIDKMWPSNAELNVLFLDGSESQIDLVKNISQLWLKNTNLSFKFYSSLSSAPKKTHIRISFKGHTGSTLGNHNNLISREATLNLLELTSSDISHSGAKRLILHEIGHALGLEHEFRNPDWPYKQDFNKSIAKNCVPKMEALGRDYEQALIRCDELSSKQLKSLVRSTAYDELSIMNYAFSVTDHHGTVKSVIAQSKLSYLDQYALQKWYPVSKTR